MAKGIKTGGGSRKGVPNKATADVRAIAQEYTGKAIAALARLAGLVEGIEGAESDQAQVSAIKELLDRGHGKASQALELTGEGGGPIQIEALRSKIEAEVDALLHPKPLTPGNTAVH